eukprot:gene20502-40298_t
MANFLARSSEVDAKFSAWAMATCSGASASIIEVSISPAWMP